MSSDEKDGDTHCGVFFFPCSERIDSESQSESRSVCFIVGSTITAYVSRVVASHLFSWWMLHMLSCTCSHSFTSGQTGFPNERMNRFFFVFFYSSIANVFYICCHNGWHSLIMSIISLFNTFDRVQIGNRWRIGWRALYTTRPVDQQSVEERYTATLEAQVGNRSSSLR